MNTRKRVRTNVPVIPEKLVTYIWEHQLVNNLSINTGEKLEVIYPGRVSSDSGGDFKDGVFIIGDDLIYGNVEVHVKTSQWYAHGHNLNPEYNGVVLHVVMWQDISSATMLECGKSIPVVNISSFIKNLDLLINYDTKQGSIYTGSCNEVNRFRDNNTFIELLTNVGILRFNEKVELYCDALKNNMPDEVLFFGVADAMGYTKNKSQFEKLAWKIIDNDLKSFMLQTTTTKKALLLGLAGLLPSQRPELSDNKSEEIEVRSLENTWNNSKVGEPMKLEEWNLYRIRPDNHPTRRAVALAYLTDRYFKKGFTSGLLNLVGNHSAGAAFRDIENGLIIANDGYWSNHVDFGVAKSNKTAVLGRTRAREIVINVLLPFSSAWEKFAGGSALINRVEDIYRNYPSLLDNQLTNHMKRQFLNLYGINLSACQQQGLIHIYKRYCRYRNCGECVVKLKC